MLNIKPNISHQLKIKEFQVAMDRYNRVPFYTHISRMISLAVMCLQLISIMNLIHLWQVATPLSLIFAFLCAYITTDFINGFAHLYMDNNTNYNSRFGPFIAAFHLHHVKPKYATKHPLEIYFYESGTKFWLVAYLILLILIQSLFTLPFTLLFGLTCIGTLSSFAELSHYWCHNAKDSHTMIRFFQKYGLLLSREHHLPHHRDDNTHYAFLNGVSNPLLNKIAGYFYRGYKQHTDKHAEAYAGTQTRNQR